MTCQECQPLAIDLARGLPPFGVGGAVQRADVLSHVATCKRCAQWLREQEALSDALRAAAEADAPLAAPPGVEANVMAAWRARQARRPLPLAGSASYADAESPTRADHSVARVLRLGDETHANSDRAPLRMAASPPDRPGARPAAKEAPAWRMAKARAFRPAWPAGRAAAFAAAATIVIAALTLASLRWLSPSPAVNGGTNNAASATTASAAPPPVTGRSSERARDGGASEAARVTDAGTNAAVVEVLPDKGTKATKGRPAPPRAAPPHAAIARGLDAVHEAGAPPRAPHESPSIGRLARAGFADRAGTERAGASGRGTRGANVTRVAGATRRGNTRRASSLARGASEFGGPAFVLLPYVEPLRPTEMRHIMRVRMPRAQLAAGGAQADSADDAVLADVLVGEDGTARAVRIVQ